MFLKPKVQVIKLNCVRCQHVWQEKLFIALVIQDKKQFSVASNTEIKNFKYY